MCKLFIGTKMICKPLLEHGIWKIVITWSTMWKTLLLEIIMSKCDWKSRCVLLTFWINNLKRNYIPSELIFELNSWILDFFVSFSNDFFTCQVITIFQMPWSNNVLQILCVLKKSQINSTNWSISISLHFYRI